MATDEVPVGLEWSPGAVAAMLGISPTTLRTWDHRYGLGPSRHETGRHRRYDPTDVARLRRMVELTAQGVTPAAAAAAVLGQPVPQRPRDGGGGRIVPARAGGTRMRGFARAAARLDAPLLTRLATDLVREHGVVAAWERFLVPYLVELGEQTAGGSLSMDVEHVASASILDALRAITAPDRATRLPALLACAPDEQHWLPMQALAAALAERGCASRGLGARVPGSALLAAVGRLEPLVVVVWAHTPALARGVPLAELGERGVLVGGPGWARTRVPPGTHRVGSLREAVAVVMNRTGSR